MLAVALLIVVIVCVQWQVIGRYVFNDTPTWAEAWRCCWCCTSPRSASRSACAMPATSAWSRWSSLLPERWRLKLEILIHVLVALFGVLMAWSGWLWTPVKWNEKKPMLGVPGGVDYLPLVVAGVLIVLFSIEHIIALLRGEEVVPAWN